MPREATTGDGHRRYTLTLPHKVRNTAPDTAGGRGSLEQETAADGDTASTDHEHKPGHTAQTVVSGNIAVV